MKTFQDIPLEEALVSLSRLLKAASYYPGAHPAVNKAVEDTTQKLKHCVAQSPRGAIALEIKRQGFLHEKARIAPENKILPQLAQRFFEHKIKSLAVLEDLREQHLLALVQCLTLEPQQLEASGGAITALERAQVSSIVLNQIDLGAIGSARHKRPSEGSLQAEELSTRSAQAGNKSGSREQGSEEEQAKRNRSLAQMLQEAQRIIKQGNEEQLPALNRCLDNIRPRLDSLIAAPQHHPDALKAIALLDNWIHSEALPESYIEACKKLLRHLDPGRTAAMLIDSASNDPSQRNLALRTIKLLDSASCASVWEQLIVEPNPQVRRFLTSVMAALGPAADRIMLEHLDDSRWYVVRNALNILSSRRNPEYIGAFKARLAHRDQRVAKEALGALAAIRHTRATDVLLEYLSLSDCPLEELAILALGAQQDPRAIPMLSRIALQKDPLIKQKKNRLKAIEALGESRNPDANPALVAIIKRGKMIKRSEYLELRLAAISALGKTAQEEERDLLQRMSTSHNPSIAKGARKALQSGQKE
ncbi:MAG: HEAT repeat domain-containing protein [Desulfuromonadaceae bacterium]